jgi:hypothetical protein
MQPAVLNNAKRYAQQSCLLLREAVDGECVGAFRCASERAAGTLLKHTTYGARRNSRCRRWRGVNRRVCGQPLSWCDAAPTHAIRDSAWARELFNPSFNKRIAISPDGTIIAFNALMPTGANQIFLRSLGELQLKQLEGVRAGIPFFAPQGQWMGYLAAVEGGLRKVSLSGGAPITLTNTTPAIAGATWAEADRIYLVPDNPGGLARIAASGGQVEEVAKLDFEKGERLFKYPQALPGGKSILLTIGRADS